MKTRLSGLFIPNNSDRLLVIHRNTAELAWWEVIGGKKEENEESGAAAVREAKEEARIKVDIHEFLYDYTFTHGDQEWSQDVWSASIVSGNPYVGEPSMHDELAWMSVTELRRRTDVSPALAYLVKKVVDGEVSMTL